MSFIRLQNLLGSTSGLTKIVRRAQDMEALAERLRQQLPDAAADALLAVNLREDGELVLIVPSSAWASRLRFESEALADTARAAGFIVKSVKVAVSQET